MRQTRVSRGGRSCLASVFLVLAILAVIITVVACAQKKKPNLTPTREQAAMLAAAQADLRVAADQLLQVQQTYNQAAQMASRACSITIKANNWPADVKCSLYSRRRTPAV